MVMQLDDVVLRIHATNVQGMGAQRLLESLIPPLVARLNINASVVYGSSVQTELFQGLAKELRISYYKRYLPNSVSRFLECTLFGFLFNGDGVLLTLGDIPLRSNSPQVVFVQTPHLFQSPDATTADSLKYRILRWVFKRNLRFADLLIVQTDAMSHALLASYPELENKVKIVCQPAPDWVLNSGLRFKGRNKAEARRGLNLFYPAAYYHHKNHHLLAKFAEGDGIEIDQLTLTIPAQMNPNPELKWIDRKSVV